MLVAVLAEHRVDELAVVVDGSIEVAPAAGDLHVRLVDVPGTVGATPASDDSPEGQALEGYTSRLSDFFVPLALLLGISVIPVLLGLPSRISEAFGIAVISAAGSCPS